MSDTFDAMGRVFTQAEIQDKKRREAIIESELKVIEQSGSVIGEHLMHIRDQKLYQIEYDTFEEYGDQHWGKSRAWLYNQIKFHNVTESLPENLSTIVDTESKARALAPVPKKRRMRVIHDAIEVSPNGKPTARDIAEAAERVEQASPTPPPKPQPPEPKAEVLDMTGWVVPESLHKLFERGEEVKGYLKQLATMRGMLRRVQENKDELWSPINFSSLLLQIDNVYAEMKLAAPHAVCPSCQGRDQTKTHCGTCKGRGVISEFLWRNAIPEELKAVRQKSCKK